MAADRKLWQRQIEREAYRRITAGEAPETLGELAEQILGGSGTLIRTAQRRQRSSKIRSATRGTAATN